MLLGSHFDLARVTARGAFWRRVDVLASCGTNPEYLATIYVPDGAPAVLDACVREAPGGEIAVLQRHAEAGLARCGLVWPGERDNAAFGDPARRIDAFVLIGPDGVVREGSVVAHESIIREAPVPGLDIYLSYEVPSESRLRDALRSGNRSVVAAARRLLAAGEGRFYEDTR